MLALVLLLLHTVPLDVAAVFFHHGENRTQSWSADDTRCSSLPRRSFDHKDDVCGLQKFVIGDLMRVFRIDHEFWEDQGRRNPWWGVDTHYSKGDDLPEQVKLEFYESAVPRVKNMVKQLQPYHLLDPAWRQGKAALDFGCGLGRMSNGLANLGFGSVTCVDMCQSYLDAAKTSLGSLAGRGSIAADVLSKVTFKRSDPSLLCTVEPPSVDFVHSVITLQHNKPALQAVYLEQLCDVLKSGGVGFVGLPSFLYTRDSSYDSRLQCDLNWEPPHMSMHYTSEAEVASHLSRRGCETIAKLPANDIGDRGTSLVYVFRKS